MNAPSSTSTQARNETLRRDSGRPDPRAEYKPFADLARYAVDFARDRPEVAALWCFGIGFVLGWRLKPW